MSGVTTGVPVSLLGANGTPFLFMAATASVTWMWAALTLLMFVTSNTNTIGPIRVEGIRRKLGRMKN
jgi:hypothetical protein